MESAIPPHLQTERARHRRVDDEYRPPYPSFVARYKPGVSHVVMAYFGLQHRGDRPPAAEAAIASLTALFSDAEGPSHWDRAHELDQAGFANEVFVAYWDDVGRFDRWFAAARATWTGVSGEGIGRFIEVLRPAVGRYETLFSSLGRPEGAAVIADEMSGEVLEHAYWGRHARSYSALASQRDEAGGQTDIDPRRRPPASAGA